RRLTQDAQRRPAVVRLRNAVALTLQTYPHESPDGLFVVDDEHVRHRNRQLRAPAAAALIRLPTEIRWGIARRPEEEKTRICVTRGMGGTGALDANFSRPFPVVYARIEAGGSPGQIQAR